VSRLTKRELLCCAAGLAFAPAASAISAGAAPAATVGREIRRARPGDAGWPSEQDWARLAAKVGDRLLKVRSPVAECLASPSAAKADAVFAALRNPYYLGEQAGLTQTMAWAGAWTSQPSVYAVRAESAQDVAAAVDFARTHNLRLVVKGGGHSYQGQSNAADSLLVWTKAMNRVVLHDAFTPHDCEGRVPPQPAATIGAGAIWRDAYDAVTTKGGRYVQGGGCMTVGVAGLIQSGGFGSFSKRYGLAAAGLLEAEVVTADGAVLTVNAGSHPDLFWALKGGGGGTFGIVTKLTLRTHALPEMFGGVTADITATSDVAYRRLIARVLAFYASSLFNPTWGEQLFFIIGNVLRVRMTFAGLTQDQARESWKPFFDWVSAQPSDFHMPPPVVNALPAGRFWDPTLLKTIPGVVVADERPNAPKGNILWAGDAGEVGQCLHSFQSRWLPQSLLSPEQQPRLADALYAATRRWWISLQFNKGLAGAPAEALAAAKDTAINPVALDACALAISSASEPPAYPGIAGHEPDLTLAKVHAGAVAAAMDQIRALAPLAGSYLSESDYFDPDWRDAYWGRNYARLQRVKARYDADGLFTVHHGVGSDRWSRDGFVRLNAAARGDGPLAVRSIRPDAAPG